MRYFLPASAAVLGGLLYVGLAASDAQAQPRPANMTTYSYPPNYNLYVPRDYAYNPYPAYPTYGRTYANYYNPAPSGTVYPGYGYYSTTQVVDPWFRSSAYNPGPANYYPGYNDYYSSPRYWNYYYPGWMR